MLNEEVQKLLQKEACGMPENTVFRVSINFWSRTINPAVAAIVFLSSGNLPQLGGFFTVVLFGRMYCQWPISAWYDYSTGANRSLGVTFRESNGASQTYQLFFITDKDMREFMAAVRSLHSETSSSPAVINSAVTNPPDVKSSIQVASAPVALKATQHLLPSTCAPNGTDGIPSVRESVTSPATNNGASTVVAAASYSPPDKVTKKEDQDMAPTRKTGELEQDAPADASIATSESSLVISGSVTPSTRLTRQQILATCGRLLHVFIIAGLQGETKEEVGQTVAGIKAGVLAHVMEDAGVRGLSAQALQEIEDLVRGVFDSLSMFSNDTGGERRRIQYSHEELMSRRHAAVQPACLDIPYSLKPQNSRRQTITSSHETQITRSANAMQWVLGQPSSPVPEPERTQPTVRGVTRADGIRSDKAPPSKPEPALVSSAAGAAVSRDIGLQKSRWASGEEDVKHANYFTGPRYEKDWPKRSYLNDLAQLDPQAKVTAGAEDLIDFYFPSQAYDDATVGSQAVANSGNIANASSGVDASSTFGARSRSSTSKTDSIETLRVGMSRLSIQSPRPAPAQPVQVPQSLADAPAPPSNHASTQPSSASQAAQSPAVLRGLGASRHSAGNAPSSSGQFNFHIPKPARK
jgi:hypothetical protein